jgi:hypothetical protein
MTTPNAHAGIHGSLAPFPIGEVLATADFPALDAMLGMEIEGLRGEVYRLVEASELAATADAPQCLFKRDGADDAYTVNIADGATDRPCGITVPGQVAIAVGDAFWLQVEGRATGTAGSTGSGAVTAGHYIKTDAVAGKGHIQTNTTTFAEGVTFGRALATTSADGADLLFEILGKMVG